MGYIIQGNLTSAYVERDMRFSVTVQRISRDQWASEYAWSIWSYGDLLKAGDGLTGQGSPESALAYLCRAIADDVEHWRTVERDGLCPLPFVTHPDVARWAAEEGEEIERAATATMLWAERTS